MKPMDDAAALGADVVEARGAGRYAINETFASLQGEGALAGTAMLFVRFARCNLRCGRTNEAGFDCDTDFSGARLLTADELIAELRALEDAQGARIWVLLTGGEPTLQLDEALCERLHVEGWSIAVESNGTVALSSAVRVRIDHLTVSPKTAEHTIRLRDPDELRVVRAVGQELSPYSQIKARFRFVSPAFPASGEVDPRALAWAMELVERNARDEWRLSVQQHKLWRAR